MSSHLRIISSRIDQTRPTVAAFIDFKTAFDYADNVLFFISYYGTILFSEIVKSGVRLKEKELMCKKHGAKTLRLLIVGLTTIKLAVPELHRHNVSFKVF